MTPAPERMPVFGQNGAVMNSPTMTAGMRTKYEEIGKLPPRRLMLSNAATFMVWGLFVFVFPILSAPLRDFMLASPWRAGFLAGAMLMLCVVVVAAIGVQALRRLELTGRDRTLTTPWPIRVLVATFEIISAISLATIAFVMIANQSDAFLKFVPWWLGVGFMSQLLASSLRWLADRRGWTLSPPAHSLL